MKIKTVCFLLCLLTFAACQPKKNILTCYILSIRPTNLGDREGWQGDMMLFAIIKNNNDKPIYFPIRSILIRKKIGTVFLKRTVCINIQNLSVVYKGRPLNKYIAALSSTDSIPPHESTPLRIIIYRGIHNKSISNIDSKPKKLRIADFQIRYKYNNKSSDDPIDHVCDSLTCITFPACAAYDN